MSRKKTSTNDDIDHYMRGFAFWDTNRFWRNNPYYSKKTQELLDKGVDKMRAKEKILTRLG